MLLEQLITEKAKARRKKKSTPRSTVSKVMTFAKKRKGTRTPVLFGGVWGGWGAYGGYSEYNDSGSGDGGGGDGGGGGE